MLPDTNINDAYKVAEKLRLIVEESKFWRQQSNHLTASFGISQLRSEDKMTDMIKRADEALYYAKEHGRNTVCHSENVQGATKTGCLSSFVS